MDQYDTQYQRESQYVYYTGIFRIYHAIVIFCQCINYIRLQDDQLSLNSNHQISPAVLGELVGLEAMLSLHQNQLYSAWLVMPI